MNSPGTPGTGPDQRQPTGIAVDRRGPGSRDPQRPQRRHHLTGNAQVGRQGGAQNLRKRPIAGGGRPAAADHQGSGPGLFQRQALAGRVDQAVDERGGRFRDEQLLDERLVLKGTAGQPRDRTRLGTRRIDEPRRTVAAAGGFDIEKASVALNGRYPATGLYDRSERLVPPGQMPAQRRGDWPCLRWGTRRRRPCASKRREGVREGRLSRADPFRARPPDPALPSPRACASRTRSRRQPARRSVKPRNPRQCFSPTCCQRAIDAAYSGSAGAKARAQASPLVRKGSG